MIEKEEPILCLDANNFGAFAGNQGMGGGPPPPPPSSSQRGGHSQRGGYRGGGVSDTMRV